MEHFQDDSYYGDIKPNPQHEEDKRFLHLQNQPIVNSGSSSSLSRAHSSTSIRSLLSSVFTGCSTPGYAKEDDSKQDHFTVPGQRYSEPPSAYTPGRSVETAEDPLELLRQFNPVIILDDSGSMNSIRLRT